MEMTLGLLTPEYPHPHCGACGGIGSSVQNSARALVQLGHKVIVFVYGQSSNQVLEDQGVQLHLIQSKSYRFAGWYLYRKHIQKYVNACVLTEKIQLLEAPDWTGITAFINLKAPLVIRFHGTDAYFCHLEGRRQKLKNFLLEKWAMRRAIGFSTPTNFAAEITKYIFRIKKKPIVTIPNGINLGQFNNPNPNEFESGLILYFGTLIRKKGVFELVDIFSKVLEKQPTARLLLVGADAPDIQSGVDSTWSEIQKNAAPSVLKHITYAGKVSYDQMQEFISKAQLCVLPSLAETQGMVTLEAMAMQKPVLTSNRGWSAELITPNQSGFLLNPHNHEEFAACICELLADAARCLAIGSQARAQVQLHFDSLHLAQQTAQFYETLIQQPC